MNMLKLLQEMRGFSELSRLQPVSKPPALYLMQLRLHSARARRAVSLEIQFDARDLCDVADPVKIRVVPPA